MKRDDQKIVVYEREEKSVYSIFSDLPLLLILSSLTFIHSKFFFFLIYSFTLISSLLFSSLLFSSLLYSYVLLHVCQAFAKLLLTICQPFDSPGSHTIKNHLILHSLKTPILLITLYFVTFYANCSLAQPNLAPAQLRLSICLILNFFFKLFVNMNNEII